MSSSSKKDNENDNPSQKQTMVEHAAASTQPKNGTTTTTTTTNSNNTNNMNTQNDNNNKMGKIANYRIPNMSSTDFMSMMGVGFLFFMMAVAPQVIEQTKKSKVFYTNEDIEENIQRQMWIIHKDLAGEDGSLLAEMRNLDTSEESLVVTNTKQFIVDILKSEPITDAIETLVSHVVESERFQKACKQLVKNLWYDLIYDPETTAQVVTLLKDAIQNEPVKKAFKELVLELVRDDEVNHELTKLVTSLGDQQEVLDATVTLLTQSTHKTLNDPEILDHSMEFATDVVGDDFVQRSSGEALRKTVTYAVLPSFSTVLAFMGVGLLLLSFSAFQNARSSVRDGQEMNAASSIVVRGLGKRAMSNIEKLLDATVRACSMVASTILGAFLFPFKIIGNVVSLGARTLAGVFHSIANKVSSLLSNLLFVTRQTFVYTASSLLHAISFPFQVVGQSLAYMAQKISTTILRAVTTAFKTFSAPFRELGTSILLLKEEIHATASKLIAIPSLVLLTTIEVFYQMKSKCIDKMDQLITSMFNFVLDTIMIPNLFLQKFAVNVEAHSKFLFHSLNTFLSKILLALHATKVKDVDILAICFQKIMNIFGIFFSKM
eukprot:CAMPEP_0184860072 /NCGR_PEP_ID=MMETSP0580-20130426/5025_1 /TAXON_ID=1118495 /ORGANISM="Dactyliosolen fragilissimus" /LENGTH=603 /DNA_ID=CAMNT_0027357031 /DNA_START=600 /DNA_END=2411 /DNA_ORIENTATION=-